MLNLLLDFPQYYFELIIRNGYTYKLVPVDNNKYAVIM